MRKNSLLILFLAFLMLLSGCTPAGLEFEENTAELPQTETTLVAPVGDAGLSFTENVEIYVPSSNGIGLSVVEITLTRTFTRPRAEAIVRGMLSYGGSGSGEALGGITRLSLYGTNPVEVSGNTVTVNLGASALSLDRFRLYLCGQAIANTLFLQEGIQYVNLLVVGKPVGLDVGNTLPMGAFTYTDAADVNAVYQQLLTRKVGSEETAAEKALAVNLTCYYPVPGENGVKSHTLNTVFSGQFSGTLAMDLLDLLSQQGGMPNLREWLTAVPSIVNSDTQGGDLVLLDFASETEKVIASSGLNRRAVMASLCMTFATFLPNVVGISVTVGGERVDPMFLMEDNSQEAHGEIILRKETGCSLYDDCILYLASGEELISVTRPVPFEKKGNPRELLLLLSQGPQANDEPAGESVFPGETLTDSMIIGMSLQGDTMLVNFAPGFVNVGADLDAQQEKRLVYALVNTLCATGLCKNVCFFRSGKQFDGFSGEISWLGLFYPIVSF